MEETMTNFESKLKIYVLMVVFLSCAGISFAQETSAPTSSVQRPASNVQRPVSDVVEVETEVGVTQMKPSERIEKPTIKPRADYVSDRKLPLPDDLETTSNVQRPVTSYESPTSSVQPPATSVQPPTSSLQPPASNVQRPASAVETITDAQVVELSSSLRKLIEDNNKLKSQIADLDSQLKTVRGQQKLESNRFNEVALERDALKKQNENIVLQGSQTQKQLEALQQQLTQKEQDYSMQIVRLQTELAQKLRNAAVEPPPTTNDQLPTSSVQPPASSDQQPASTIQRPSVSVNLVSAPTPEEAKERGQKVLLALNSVSEEKQKLSRDEAKVHYNMGNTYFNQGDYVQAAKEYARAIELSPEDASAHYNLAFVSGEFLNDPKVALDHYKKYLYFNPRAEDAQMVEQKIIEAEISVKGDVHFKSQINEELRHKKNDANEILH